ncbi:MAG: hypothetical protein QXR62_06575 [Candidatus Bathyarchaeia archaeon]
MIKNTVLPVGPSPRPGKRTSLLWLEGSLQSGTPRYTPAWEKIGSIVSRALEYEFEEEEWEEYEEEFDGEEEYDEFDEFAEYLDNQRW